MTSVKLKFRASAMPDKAGSLCFQIIHRRAVRQIGTGYRLFAREWDGENSRIVVPDPGCSRSAELETMVGTVSRDMRRLKGIVRNLENGGLVYSVDDVVAAFCNSAECEVCFLDHARKHIARLRSLGSRGTAGNLEAALNRFVNYRKGRELHVSMMTAEMIEEYEAYLKSRGNCRNTISFYMRNLRSIYNQVVERTFVERKDIFKRVYTGVDKTIKRAIPLKAIRRIRDLDLSAYPELEVARDLFMFSFYTRGMSFIDLAYLRKKDVAGNSLTYRRRKTGQQLSICWEKEMRTIVSKYCNSTRYLLPVIVREDGTEYRQYRNALMLVNRKLKKIARLAGISHPLSMYTTRHSWATIARDKSVPLSVISKALGHDNDSSTQIYLASIQTAEVDRANRKILRDLRKD